MEILLIDRRARAHESAFNTSLGKIVSMDLTRDSDSYMLAFETDLAYWLNVKLASVEIDQLRSLLTKANTLPCIPE